MDKANKVYFKATKDNIIVMLDDEVGFDELKASLGLKAKEARKFFGDLSASVVFRGRGLTSREEAVLVDIIESETNLKVYVTEEIEENYTEKALESNAHNVSNVVNMPGMGKLLNVGKVQSKSEFKSSARIGTDGAARYGGSDTVFHKGSLRSGQSIETPGSAVIIGDVNPGGEITAGGNIVVLGALKGLAHAGAYGNGDAFVAAIVLSPVQLRIANMIAILAEEIEKQKKEGSTVPSYAYIHNEQICIEPLL